MNTNNTAKTKTTDTGSKTKKTTNPTSPTSPTQSSTTATAKTLSVDVGNYAIKVKYHNEKVVTVRSLYAPILHGVTAKRHTEDSPTVVVGNDRYHFGESARKYRVNQAVCNTDKLDPQVFLPCVFSAITEDYQGTDISLYLSIPAFYKQDQAVVLKELLLGRHTFTRNGVLMMVNITDCVVVLEGIGAWHTAKLNGLVPTKGLSVLIDIGGSTINAMVIDEDGELVGEPLSFDKLGGVRLAAMIAENTRLKGTLGTEPSIDLIMDGVSNGTWKYAETDVSFEYGKDYIKTWFKSSFDTIRTNIAPYLPQTRVFLFTGGNANLLQSLLSNVAGCVVVPCPVTANVQGLVYGKDLLNQENTNV